MVLIVEELTKCKPLLWADFITAILTKILKPHIHLCFINYVGRFIAQVISQAKYGVV
jgi:hypothetical protein